MKNIYTILVLAGALAFVSCSKEYFNTYPTEQIGTSTIFETVDNMQLAVNGLYNCMSQQYGGFKQGFNGEGTVKFYLGNYSGNNFNRFTSGDIYLVNNTFNIDPKSKWLLYPWFYYYRVIGNANNIIVMGPHAQGPEDRREYLIAQAKVVRAFCYMQLSQRFHYRWSMGKHGEAANGNGLVLKLDNTNDALPLSSADDTFAQIYKDLDEAIPVLQNGAYKRDRVDENYQVDAHVAYAIYARAALVREDYETALKYAVLAGEGYPLMSNEEYLSGFNFPNQEWIWSSYGDITENLFYYGFFAYMSYDSSAGAVKNYPKSISKLLYERIPDTDIRKTLFLDPGGLPYSKTTGEATTTSGSVSKSAPLRKKAIELHPDLHSAAKVVAYHAFKFNCLENPGIGHLNHFRTSEMLLIQAEADYFLNREADARAALVALNAGSGRNPQYTCGLSGEALLEEIKLYRSIELWGEGFEWFDLKRWNDPIDRKGFNEGGNSYDKFAFYCDQNRLNNWWTSVVPEKETNYNPNIK